MSPSAWVEKSILTPLHSATLIKMVKKYLQKNNKKSHCEQETVNFNEIYILFGQNFVSIFSKL